MFIPQNHHGHATHDTRWVAGEKRLCFTAMDKLKAYGSIAGEKAGTAWKVTKIATTPIRWIFSPFTKGLSLGAKGVGMAWDKARTPGFASIEAAKGVKDTTWQPLLTLGSSPFWDVYMNLWHVPKGVFKSIFALPGVVARTPGAMIGGFRTGLKNLFEAPGKILDATMNMSPMGVLKATRDAITGTLMPPITETLNPYGDLAWNVAAPAINSKVQYLYAINESRKQFTGGLKRIANSPNVGASQAEAIRAEKAAKRAAIEAALKSGPAPKDKPAKGKKDSADAAVDNG